MSRTHSNDSSSTGLAAPAVLQNECIQATILPGKGCDIYALRDLDTGIDVLAKTRVQLSDLQSSSYAASSAEAWLAQYVGGWQLVLPNGGAPGRSSGAEWGFHGEACQLRWNVTAQSDTQLEAYVRLLRAPLVVKRHLEVSGRTLAITEFVANEGASPVEVMWAHHPAFGAPFLEGGCLISTGARAVVADDENPGTAMAPGSVHQWPTVTTTDSRRINLDRAPNEDSGIAHLAYLSEFETGYFAITNPRLHLGVALSWSTDVFPHAWYWVEARATPGFPWFGRHYTLAIEPATSKPAQGIEALRAKGGEALTVEPGQEVSTRLEATLFRSDRAVTNVQAGGSIAFAD